MEFGRYVDISGNRCRLITCDIVVVGSGAAAFNAALNVKRNKNGTNDVVMVTEGRMMGTSRNTGSDKQTYYKLSTTSNSPDCARSMAEDMFSCGSMHGDLAMVEAAGSLKGFYNLISLGVPFPSDTYGEYTGYKTDHDSAKRASSCGPLTSKYMTEALERACSAENVPLLDGYRVIQVLTENGEAKGVVCLAESGITASNPSGLTVVLSGAVIWATGGPSAVYRNSVYPQSQNCSLGTPMAAGASAVNLTEGQYGIASVDFRWNLSGSYQQVIPKYVTMDREGNISEFLREEVGPDYVRKIFRKGYEWPFDPDKITSNSRSSLVDLAVFKEICAGHRVFMDFRSNPAPIEENGLTVDVIGEEAYSYLAGCSALGKTPVERLRQMNERAYQLYLSHGIDLEKDLLEIGVCAQHMNGGLECGIWYENPELGNFYPVGECGGVFGIKRPGGSALNSTQVGSSRAAERASALRIPKPDWSDVEISAACEFAAVFAGLLKDGGDTLETILKKREEDELLHDECAAFIRNEEKIRSLLSKTGNEIKAFFRENSADSQRALVELSINYDILITRYAILSSILKYIDDGGLSRGSYLIGNGEIPERVETDTSHRTKVLVTKIRISGEDIEADCRMDDVRPIPVIENQFENVYNAFGKTDNYI